MSFNEILKATEDKMEKAAAVLKEDMKGIRSGRATPWLVEGVRAEYYGTQTPLKQMAAISCPDPRMIVIKPYDQTALAEIEKALLKANIGLTPQNDGKLIRLKVPELSQERRQQLVGQIKEMSEKARVAIRNIRRDSNKDAEKAESDGALSEDEAKKLKDKIQDATKKHEKQVDEILEKKRKEIMES